MCVSDRYYWRIGLQTLEKNRDPASRNMTGLEQSMYVVSEQWAYWPASVNSAGALKAGNDPHPDEAVQQQQLP